MTNGNITYKSVLEDITKLLEKKHIETARLDATLIVCKAYGISKLQLLTNQNAVAEYNPDLDELLGRRLEHEPMQYIIGSTEFMGIDFKVNKNVLIPRPDTEILVEAVLDKIKGEKKHFVDIGTGSGCIAVSILANNKLSSAIAADISVSALELARENALKNGVGDRISFINMDIMSQFPEEAVDFIVSNPPYIEHSLIDTLMPDVKNFEPHNALDGGEDGLDFYRRIAAKGRDIIKNGGFISFEIGCNQADEVVKILADNNYSCIRVIKDLSDNDRVVIADKI